MCLHRIADARVTCRCQRQRRRRRRRRRGGRPRSSASWSSLTDISAESDAEFSRVSRYARWYWNRASHLVARSSASLQRRRRPIAAIPRIVREIGARRANAICRAVGSQGRGGRARPASSSSLRSFRDDDRSSTRAHPRPIVNVTLSAFKWARTALYFRMNYWWRSICCDYTRALANIPGLVGKQDRLVFYSNE